MTISEMLGQSAILTLLGMCVVFFFLIVLIICMNLLRKAVHAFKLDVEEPKAAAASSAPAPASDPNAVIAAIATAVREKELQ